VLQSTSQTCTASEVAEDKKTKFADEDVTRVLEGEPRQRAGRNIVDKAIVEYTVRTDYCMYEMWEPMS